MMKFYLNNEEVEVRKLPQLQMVKDENPDSFQVVLKSNNRKQPYEPYSTFKIETDEGNLYFSLVSDNVKLMSVFPSNLYSHELVLTQNIRALSSYMIRNNVFSQPSRTEKTIYFAKSEYLLNESGVYSYIRIPGITDGEGNETPQAWFEPITIGRKDKIKNIKIRIRQFEAGDYMLNEQTGVATDIWWRTCWFYKANSGVVATIDLRQNTYNEWFDAPTTLKEYIEENGNGEYYINLPNRLNRTAFEDSPLTVIMHCEIKIEYYYFTAYDIVKELLRQTNAKYGNKVIEMPPEGSELYSVLKEYIPQNMTFTQSNLYDALVEIFKFFDAIFTLEDNVLGIEYYNERNKEKATLNNMVGYSTSYSEKEYKRGMINYYQNAKVNIEYPSVGYCNLRNNQQGVGSDAMTFIVPYPINVVKKFYSFTSDDTIVGYVPSPTYANDTHSNRRVRGSYELDLTSFLYEQSIYAMLNISSDFPHAGDYSNRTQANCIYYSRNSNNVDVAATVFKNIFGIETNSIQNAMQSAWNKFLGLRFFDYAYFKQIDNDWKQYRFRIEYEANVNGRARVETYENKHEGSMIVNQGSGQVDLNKLGLNMLGLSLKLGQPTLSFSHRISPYEERVKKGDIYEDENGNIWVANVCTYTLIDENTIQGNVEFTKNFNALASNTRVDHEKRLTNISDELAMKCEDDIIEYLYFTQETPFITEGSYITFGASKIRDAIKNTLFPEESDNVVDAVLIQAWFDDNTTVTFGSKNFEVKDVYIPVVSYAFGNALCFEMSFDSPISAGKQTTYGGEWYAQKYYTIDYLYTDDEGWFDKVTLSFVKLRGSITQDFPKITTDYSYVGAINGYKYYKKPNEIFALNYEIICLPRENRINIDFIGQAFMRGNALIGKKNNEKTYLYYETTDDFKYSVLDNYGHGNRVEVTLDSIDFMAVGRFYIGFDIDTGLEEKPKAWSLCNERGEILLASNECLHFDEGIITFYFIPSTKRL